MFKLLLLLLSVATLFSSSTYYEYGKKVELTPHTQNKSLQLNKQDRNISLRYYKNKNDRVIGVDNTIIAKCLQQKDCISVINKYTNLRYKTISKDTYLISVDNQEEVFTMSVKLYEEGCFKYAHPNFYRQRELR